MNAMIKRQWIAILMAPMFLLWSCVKEIEKPKDLDENLHEVVFHAGWDDETKTVLQEDGNIFWEPGDEISLFYEGCPTFGFQLSSTNSETAAHADFIGQIGEKSSSASYVAVYPYDDFNLIIDNSIIIATPYDQIACESTFAKKSFISIAVSNDESLYFENVLSGIKFSVKTPGIKKIEINTNLGEYIYGGLKYSLETKSVSFYNPRSSVTILPPSESGFEPDKYYYVSLYPTESSSGVTVSYYKDDTVARYVYDKPVVFTKGTFKRLYNKDEGLIFKPSYNTFAYLTTDLFAGIDKSAISGLCFHTKSSIQTDHMAETHGNGENIYLEQKGSELHYYTIADAYKCEGISTMFAGWTALKTINLSMVDTHTCDNFYAMFDGCRSLESIEFGGFFDTSAATDMSSMFAGCSSLKSLDLSGFNTEKVVSMRNMFGSSENISFQGCVSLEELDLSSFNTSNVENMFAMFEYCSNLRTINLSGWDTSKVTTMSLMFCGCASLDSIDLSSFDTGNVTDFGDMFSGCNSLKTLDLSNLNTTNAVSMVGMFRNNPSLHEINLSGIAINSNLSLRCMFEFCYNLQKIDLGYLDLSCVPELDYILRVTAKSSKACAIRCTEKTKEALLNRNTYIIPDYFTWVLPEDNMPDLEPIVDPNLYYSTDYTKNRTVVQLAKATKGNGVDILLIGDAYSDRLINDGTYERDMREAMGAIFEMEPFKSYKELFNVYMVYAVSKNEISTEETAIGLGVVNDDIYYDTGSIKSYAQSVLLPAGRVFSDAAIVVISHDEHCFDQSLITGQTYIQYGWGAYETDYGQTMESYSVIPKYSNSDVFKHVLNHEFGHCFAKLADEYYQNDCSIPFFDYEYFVRGYNSLGLFKNIDFTSDPSTIKWSKFLKDSRYAYSGIGVFEGGGEFAYGVWRPSENSIMCNGTEFNAPSREAIYYRIHKLAYGKDWQYDYETFVQQDLKNIQPVAGTASVKPVPYPARVSREHLFKVEESTDSDGQKIVTVIMD